MDEKTVLEVKLKMISFAFFCLFISILIAGIFVITALGGLIA